MKKQIRKNPEQNNGFFNNVKKSLTSLTMQKAVLAVAIIFALAFIVAAGNVIIKNGQVNAADNLVVDTNTLFVNATNDRVGIGTTSPGTSYKIEVNGSALFNSANGNTEIIIGVNGTHDRLRLAYSPSTDNAYINSYDAGTSAYKILNIDGNVTSINAYSGGSVGIGTTSPGAKLNVRDNTASNYVSLIQNINANGHGLKIKVGSASSDYPLGIVNYGETYTLMVVRGDGSVGIGTSIPAQTLTVIGNISASNLPATGANNYLCYKTIGSNNVLGMCSSLLEYKENVSNMEDIRQKLIQLNPVTFNYKGQQEKSVGFIAEDLEKVFPEVAEYDVNGTLMGVNYPELSVLAIKSIQEQQKEIDSLKQIVCKNNPDEEYCKA